LSVYEQNNKRRISKCIRELENNISREEKKTKTPPFPVSATGKDCIIVGPSQNSHLVVHFRSEIFLPTSKVAMCHNQYLLGS
jgi:hypothetical protein